MSGFLEQVQEQIRRRSLFRRGQLIVVAVSGGLDSMVLLHLLHALAPARGWKLIVAHVNHQLRSRASLADERLVVRTAARLGWPIETGRVDVRRLSKEGGVSVEMAARQLRHQFLSRVAAGAGCRTVALAHHADDQVEQFFLRLFRGAGPEGLAGLKWKNRSAFDQRITLARPLLGQSRESILRYAAECRIRFREDDTNRSVDIQRNSIRHQLLPVLRRRYQPSLSDVILRQTEILSADADYLSEEARAWLAGGGRKPFAKLHVALQRQCILEQLHRSGVPANFELVERLRHRSGQSVSVGPGKVVSRDGAGRLKVEVASGGARFRNDRVDLELSGRGGVLVFDGLSVDWSVRRGGGIPKRRVGGCEWFDADRVGEGVELRHWRRGDRFHPIGMPASVKLQDWFVNQRIPREERHRLVLGVTRGGEIWWVEGLRIGERFKVDSGTRRRLCWTWKR